MPLVIRTDYTDDAAWRAVVLDPMYYQELIDAPPPREVRVVPDAVHMVHGNLQLANVDIPEFAEDAAADPDGVVRDVVTAPAALRAETTGRSHTVGPPR
ncbi:DUF6924 domain-containing protein [Streptomyces sp. NPDC091289]|uniref:DUF6924 domain-containing protein n=1 Tax=Streptomyces sp. NPDC091289 TaxID=3365989 RepID=UPI003823041C